MGSHSPGMFEEIKKSCKSKNSDATSVVDDVHGAGNISNHFKNIYEHLYNEISVMMLSTKSGTRLKMRLLRLRINCIDNC